MKKTYSVKKKLEPLMELCSPHREGGDGVRGLNC